MDKITTQRNYRIVKSNDLVQRSRYSLTEKEQKIILYLISLIKPDDTELQEYTFNLRDFCLICGIDPDEGKNFRNIREAIDSLKRKSFWILQGNDLVSVDWIAKARIHTKTSTATIRLDEDLKPYLLQLKDNFTAYELEYVLAMRGVYALRLYELLKSYAFVGHYEVSIGDLRDKLQLFKKDKDGNLKTDPDGNPIPLYPDFRGLRRRVIEPAIEEINQFTDITIKFEPVRAGRKTVKIDFTISQKDYIERCTSIEYRLERLPQTKES